MAHTHGGRQYGPNLHTKFGYGMMAALTVDFLIGLALFLKPNAFRELSPFKCAVTWIQCLLNKVIVAAGWVLMVNGGVTALGFCGPVRINTTELSNCVAHSIMGLAFLGHGIFWLVMLQQVGRSWLSWNGRLIDFYDSLHFLFWGVLNTVTEHNWLGDHGWSMREIEHTSNEILFLTDGLLGVWLTWRRSTNRPAQSPMLAIVMFIAGWTISSHPQPSKWSTEFHAALKYTMMALGVMKILKTMLILKDRPYLRAMELIDSFQYIPIVIWLFFIHNQCIGIFG